MSDLDPAFLWETEAMRSSSRRVGDAPPPVASEPPRPGDGSGWVTLRDAHLATGIPIGTLRKWARREHVPSRMSQTEFGTRRMVRIDDVQARAARLGRRVSPTQSDEDGVVVDAPQSEPEPPLGTMIVPVEAWDKMLMQLGNLHEAGQQLADARERAAKAETEAKFLRERLAELRSTPDQRSTPEPAAPASLPRPAPRQTETRWRYAVRRWQEWRSAAPGR